MALDYQLKYDAGKVSGDFLRSRDKLKILAGPVGCVSPDTLILTEFGPTPISDIDRPMRVLSWNAKTYQFQLSWCGGAFQKGTDYLYRVSTPRGEFDAAGNHLLLCADGEYRPVAFLHRNPQCVLAACSEAPLDSKQEPAPPESPKDARRLLRTPADYLGGCVGLARQYGQRLLRVVGSVRASLLEPAGAQLSVLSLYPCAPSLLGGLWVLSRVHTHPGQSSDRTQTYCFSHLPSRPLPTSACHGVPLSGERTGGTTRLPRLSRLMSALRHNKEKPASHSHSCSYSLSKRPIVSITRNQVKQDYWDMQVAGTNNYVTPDGTIHHNSGKTSASIMHILLNAIGQEPDTDGIRRTRHLVVRNTVPMLKQTTIKSFLDWLPDGVFGKWLSSDRTYYMKFDDVEAEVLFMSLEDANDIRKLLSLETTTAFFNEFREINPDIVEGLIGTKRVGRYPSRKQGPGATYPCIFADTNMPAQDSWHQQVMDGQIGNWKLFKQPSGRSDEAENLQFLPPGYYDTEGLSEEYIRTMIDCEYGTSREGLPVFRSTFIPDFHIAKEPLKPLNFEGSTLLIGLDAGLTPAAIIAQSVTGGRILILGECYTKPEESMGMERFLDTKLVPMLRSRFAGCTPTLIVDPAARQRSQATEETVFEIIEKKRLKVVPAPSNKPELRIGSAEMLFARQSEGKALLSIDQSCTGLISALKYGYKYAAKKDGEIEEKPLKSHPDSDIADAFTYLTLYLGGEQRGFGRSERREIKPAPLRWAV